MGEKCKPQIYGVKRSLEFEVARLTLQIHLKINIHNKIQNNNQFKHIKNRR